MKTFSLCVCVCVVISLLHATYAGPPGGGGPGGGAGGPDGGGPGGQQGGPPRGGFSQDGGFEKGHGQGGPGGHGGPRGSPPQGGPPGQGGQSMVQQLMLLDANGDGSLTPDEVTDPRAMGLLQHADTDGNGAVTLAELQGMENQRPQGGGPGGGRGPGGGEQGPPPRPGEVLPDFVQNQLQLTDAQRQQIAALQAQVDAQLLQILTAQQIQLLAADRQGSPGGGQFSFAGDASANSHSAKSRASETKANRKSKSAAK